MNKIIRKHYPVDRLPADLRSGLQRYGWVRIEIEPESVEPESRLIATLVGSGRNLHGSPDDVLAYIQAARDDQ